MYLPWASHLHNVDIEGADGDGGPDGGHEGPGVHPGVSQVHHQVVIPPLKNIIWVLQVIFYKEYNRTMTEDTRPPPESAFNFVSILRTFSLIL